MPKTDVLDGFVTYQKQRRRRVGATEPVVSITKSGQLAFNKVAAALFKERPNLVNLLYNPTTKQIAIRGTSVNDDSALTVRYLGSGQGLVSAKNFLLEHSVDFSTLHHYTPETLDDKTLLIETKR